MGQEVSEIQKINKIKSYNKKEWSEEWGSGRKLPFLKYARRRKQKKRKQKK